MRADRGRALADLADGFAGSVFAGDALGGWDATPSRQDGNHAVAALSNALDLDVVSRLTHEAPASAAVVPTPDQVSALARLSLGQDGGAGQRYVDSMRLMGVPIDAIYLQLITPAARLLGEMWAEDLCTFVDVTIGIVRLQQIVRALSPVFQGNADRNAPGRHAVMMSVPGEQHTFGLIMAAEFLRRAGWTLECAAPPNSAGAGKIVGREWFCFVGFSLSNEGRLGTLSACIRSVRKSSLNRNIGVLVGGNVFVDRPDLVVRIGADAVAADGPRAVGAAQQFLLHGAGARV